MFVVIPFCHKDEWLAIKNLEWAKKLDGRTAHTAMVVHDDTISGDQVRHAAEQFFEKVIMFCYPRFPGRDISWPIVQNHQFQEAATFISYNGPKEPWLWWEPDSVPLKSGWIEAIEKAHKVGGKPYAGHIVTGDPFQNGHTISWMTGVGVYPPDVPSHSGAAMSCMRHPWDVASHRDVPKKCTPLNHLIQHIWEIDGKPARFADKGSVDALVSKTAVIFHRCKDGSLIEVLTGEPIYKAAAAKIMDAVGNIATYIKREINREGKLGVVQVGRYGDIVNALPAIRALGEREGITPSVVVAKEFASILDGVSYVRADVWDGPYDKLTDAVEYAKARYDSVVVGTVWGSDSPVVKKCSAYNVDSWERLGALQRWGEPMPPSFDLRDRVREREVINKVLPWTQEPIVLLSLTSGKSSPMPNGALIKSGLMKKFHGQCRFVDLDGSVFSHIYDVLGLMDFADALITSDTVWLHLAADTNVPVAALLSPQGGWYQTEPRCNCTLPLRDSSSESVGRLYE